MKNDKKQPLSNSESCGMTEAIEEVLQLAQAMSDGQLDKRASVERFTGDSAELLVAVNMIMDSLIAPLRLASSAISELAHGSIPPDFIVTEYKGEFNDIKRNLNTFLAVMYGLNHEVNHLIQSVKDGKLNTRGNDWDFEGCWKELIAGLNGTIDATVDPILEARAVLDKLATFDLTMRMSGKYKGEHAQIKKSLNSSLQNLHTAFKQVEGAVEKVSEAADQITQSSDAVAQAAQQQAGSIEEITSSMEEISRRTKMTADNALRTDSLTKESQTSVEAGKEAMGELVNAMKQIRGAAEGTQAIMQEINTITVQTDDLARSAAKEAVRVGASARGFAVVATEVRKLVQRVKTASQEITSIRESLSGDTDNSKSNCVESIRRFTSIAGELDNMALQTNYLALNAAIEAAYVDATGSGIEQITFKVQDLASNSKTSSAKTEDLLKHSMALTTSGQDLSNAVNDKLLNVVDAVASVSKLVDEIAQASQLQAEELKAISESIFQLNNVTQINAESAESSREASSQLTEQTNTLSKSVRRFQL